jgi:hypothetical protein
VPTPRAHRDPAQRHLPSHRVCRVDPLTGKERYLRRSAKTYAQAEIELTQLLVQVDEQRHPRSAVTVGKVFDKWLEVAYLEATARQRYERLIRPYIAPTLGTMSAAKLDA